MLTYPDHSGLAAVLLRLLDNFSNMTRPMPLWYVRGEGQYVNPASDETFDVSVTRVQKRWVYYGWYCMYIILLHKLWTCEFCKHWKFRSLLWSYIWLSCYFSSSNCPAIKIGSKSYGTLGAKTSMQFLRMSLPVKCNEKYAPAKPWVSKYHDECYFAGMLWILPGTTGNPGSILGQSVEPFQ